MKQNVTEDKKRVEDQRRMLEEEIADFHRRKAQYEAEKMNSGHHTLTLGKLGKKKWRTNDRSTHTFNETRFMTFFVDLRTEPRFFVAQKKYTETFFVLKFAKKNTYTLLQIIQLLIIFEKVPLQQSFQNLFSCFCTYVLY